MNKFFRVVFYIAGCVILAFGIMLNTKAGLGVSPIISFPYSVSQIAGVNFSVIAFFVYASFVVLQYLIDKSSRSIKLLFQVPFAFAFSTLLEVFGRFLKDVPKIMWLQIVVLIFAVVLIGIGISLTVNMDYVPNPADGLARSVGNALKKDMGFGKNTVDAISILLTCTVVLLLAGKIYGVGIGTVVAVILTGRVVKVFNMLFKDKMLKLAGLSEKNEA